MKILSFFLFAFLALFSSCYDSAYNPDYIISDTTSEINAVEKPMPDD